MNEVEINNIGVCTICQSIHYIDTNSKTRVCSNCGENAVKTLIELSDIANDYPELQKTIEMLTNA